VAVAHVDRGEHGVDLPHRQRRHRPLWAVRRHHADAIALFHSARSQLGREVEGGTVDLPAAEYPLATAAEATDPRRTRPILHERRGDEVPEVLLHILLREGPYAGIAAGKSRTEAAASRGCRRRQPADGARTTRGRLHRPLPRPLSRPAKPGRSTAAP